MFDKLLVRAKIAVTSSEFISDNANNIRLNNGSGIERNHPRVVIFLPGNRTAWDRMSIS